MNGARPAQRLRLLFSAWVLHNGHMQSLSSQLLSMWQLLHKVYKAARSLHWNAGVMCLAFHPEYPNLLAVGCYGGSVLIFDVRSASGAPLYASTARGGKHTEPVWQVRQGRM